MIFRIPNKHVLSATIKSCSTGLIATLDNILSFKIGEPIYIEFEISKSLSDYVIENSIKLEQTRTDIFISNQRVIDLATEVDNQCSTYEYESDNTLTSLMDADILIRLTRAIGTDKMFNILGEQYPLYVHLDSFEEFTMLVMSI